MVIFYIQMRIDKLKQNSNDSITFEDIERYLSQFVVPHGQTEQVIERLLECVNKQLISNFIAKITCNDPHYACLPENSETTNSTQIFMKVGIDAEEIQHTLNNPKKRSHKHFSKTKKQEKESYQSVAKKSKMSYSSIDQEHENELLDYLISIKYPKRHCYAIIINKVLSDIYTALLHKSLHKELSQPSQIALNGEYRSTKNANSDRMRYGANCAEIRNENSEQTAIVKRIGSNEMDNDCNDVREMQFSFRKETGTNFRVNDVEREHLLVENNQNINASKPRDTRRLPTVLVPRKPIQSPSNEEYTSTKDENSDSGVDEEHMFNGSLPDNSRIGNGANEMKAVTNINASKPRDTRRSPTVLVPHQPIQSPSNEEYTSTKDENSDSGVDEEHMFNGKLTGTNRTGNNGTNGTGSSKEVKTGMNNNVLEDKVAAVEHSEAVTTSTSEGEYRSDQFDEVDVDPNIRSALMQKQSLYYVIYFEKMVHTQIQCSAETSKEIALLAVGLGLAIQQLQGSKGKLQKCYHVDPDSKLLSVRSLLCLCMAEIESTHSQYVDHFTEAVRTHQQSSGLLRCYRMTSLALSKLTKLALDLYHTRIQLSCQFNQFDYTPVVYLATTEVKNDAIQVVEERKEVATTGVKNDATEVVEERKEVATTVVKNDATEVVEERKEVATTGVKNDATEVVEERKEVATTVVKNDATEVVEERKEVATTGVKNDATEVVEERKEVATTGVKNDATEVVEERKEVATTGVKNDATEVVEERKEVATTRVKNDATEVVEERKEVATTGVKNDATEVVEERKEVATTGVKNDATEVVEERKEVATTVVKNDATEVVEERKEVATTVVKNDATEVVEERKEIATTGVKNDAIGVVEERKEIATTVVKNDAIEVVEERKEVATTGVKNDATEVVEERKEVATTGVKNDAIGVVEERKEVATTVVKNDATEVVEERKEIATTGVKNDAIGVVEERKEIATTGVKNDAIEVVEERKEVATTVVKNDAIQVVEERKEIATTGVKNDAIGVVEERKEIATTGVKNDVIEVVEHRQETGTTGVKNNAIGVVEHRKEIGTPGMDNIVLETHITVEHNEDVSINKPEELDPFDETDIHPTIRSALVQAQSLYHAMDFNQMGYTLLQCTPNTNKEKGVLAFGLGLACYKQERYEEAIQQLQESEGKLRECYCVDSDSKLLSDRSLACLYMGEVESTHGQYLAAVDHFAEAVRTHQQSSGLLRCYGLTPLTKCAKLTKLALALRSANRVSESIKYYREALSCGESTSEDITSCHISLGNLLHNVGDHETAIEEYHKAIVLAEEQNDYQSLCWSHGNLGNAYLSHGMKDKAVYHLELALSLTQQYDPVPSSLSRALNNVGTAYQALNDIDTAEDYYDQALCQSIYGEDLVGQARAYGNIGNLCMVQKDPERAIPHYTEVLRLSKERSTSYVAYHNRGCGFYELGHKRINEQLTTGKRVDFQFTAYGPHTRDLESKHQQQELHENHRKLFKQGLSDFEKVIENHENTFSHISSSPKGLNLSVCLFENNSKTFSRAQDCAFYLGDHYRALILAERSRSRTLGELLLKRMLSMKTPLHSPLGLDQIVNIMKLQDPHVPVVMLSYTGNRLLIWILIYDGEDVKMDMIEQEPSEDLFEGKSLDNYLRYSLSELLTGNLELYGEEKECLVIDTPDSLEPNNDIGYSVPELEEQMTTDNDVPITNNNKYKLLSENHFLENEDGATKRHYQSLPPKKKMSPINKLYKLIVQPVQELLKAAEPTPSSSSLPKKKLILVPDSSTKLVPFCALKDTDDERCFGDLYSIQFVPSLLTLGILGQTEPIEISIPHDREEICVVGDPTTPPFTVKGREWNLGPLPHAKEEAEWVGHYMKTTPLLHHEPTKNVVLSRLKSAKIIHLATHGSASQAFLVLAGMSNTYNREITLTPRITEQLVQNEKDLLLYASDVESLSLSAGLVVLSSCDSGRGLIKGGDIQGMARAFLLAGSQAVLTSLWKVPDQSACYFQQFFYRYLLDGLSSSEALQKSVLSIRGFLGFSQLIHWSGYQLTGKDICIRNENANEEREVESMLGHRCSPFPRLNLLTELHNKIVKDSSTDIQV